MDSLKQKIIEKLEHLPETALQEVINFVDFLEWRKTNSQQPLTSVVDNLREEHDEAWLESDLSNLGSYEPYDWQPGEIGEGCPIEYVGGVLVVKAQGAKNLETAVQELREERIREISSW